MRILIAPDSFKGSLTAKEVIEEIKRGIETVFHKRENVFSLPLADGGEGTIDSLIDATNGTIHKAVVLNPIGTRITAKYGITGDKKKAIIELATASGLHTLNSTDLNQCAASTYGTGQLILNALDKGIRSFIICLVGSATNDCGSGLLTALGYKFLDANNEELDYGGVELIKLNTIDDSEVDYRLKESEIQVAFDVTNPLVGSNGASVVYGPQKGASDK